MITEEERDAQLAENLLDHINPNISSLTEISSYFSDYAIEQVIQDYARKTILIIPKHAIRFIPAVSRFIPQ